MTNVDQCEVQSNAAVMANTNGVSWLSAELPDSYLIQISTDYIFNGDSGPYPIYANKPSPISIYGWSKLGGELITRNHKGPWLIIRTTVLFSDSENNFVSKIVRQLRDGARVTVPLLWGTPTYVPALASEIIRLIKNQTTGIVHIAGDRVMSRYEFALAIADAFGLDAGLIGAVPYEHQPGTALRPVRAGLLCGHEPNEGLEDVMVMSHDPLGGLRELAVNGM
jgi:dTDP-4-dehydrorhamnose reductase